jgi:hypothetical protein
MDIGPVLAHDASMLRYLVVMVLVVTGCGDEDVGPDGGVWDRECAQATASPVRCQQIYVCAPVEDCGPCVTPGVLCGFGLGGDLTCGDDRRLHVSHLPEGGQPATCDRDGGT